MTGKTDKMFFSFQCLNEWFFYIYLVRNWYRNVYFVSFNGLLLTFPNPFVRFCEFRTCTRATQCCDSCMLHRTRQNQRDVREAGGIHTNRTGHTRQVGEFSTTLRSQFLSDMHLSQKKSFSLCKKGFCSITKRFAQPKVP